MLLRYAVLLLAAVLLLPGTVASAASNRTPDPVPGYHNHDALTKALRDAIGTRTDIARIVSIGKSAEGRDIWVVEVGKKSGVAVVDRPALLVVANLEGNQLAGSELALEIVKYLVGNYGTDEAVRDRVDNAAFYIIPRANPDGAERMFDALQTGGAGNTREMDDDNDGRADEDGPEDLNGDGLITVMRVADPMGEYMVDPADARLLKKADPKKGESGAFKVYWEGSDDDADGFYNEDAPGGVNLNHNFQHEYPYYTVGAGPHMVSELESRAIVDFVISHRNIAGILTFGPQDNLVVPPNNKGELEAAANVMLPSFADESNADSRKVGTFATQQRRRFFGGGQQDQSRTGRPSSGRKPETTVNKEDQEFFKKVSETYREVVGVKELPGIEKPAGALFEYGYYQFGVPSFATPGWAPTSGAMADSSRSDSSGSDSSRSDSTSGAVKPGDRGARGAGASKPGGGKSDDSSADLKLLRWMDAKSIDGFVTWTTFQHPTLGAVEIGGFKPYEYLNPPADVIAELGPKQGAFAVAVAGMFAKVRIAKTEVVDHGGGVFRIKAEVENAGLFPTSTAHGVVSRSVKPTMVQLEIDPAALLSGSAKTSFFSALDGSGNREEFEWLIKGKRGDTVTLRVVSQKGGQDSAAVKLQ